MSPLVIAPDVAHGSFNPFAAAYPTVLDGWWASDPAWTNPGDGGAVASVRNQSGRGDPAQGTGGARPTFRASTSAFNNRPTIQFDGGDWLSIDTPDGSQVWSEIIVANTTDSTNTGGGNGQTAVGTGAVGFIWRRAASAEYAMNAGSTLSGGTTNQACHIAVAVYNGASSKFGIDRVTPNVTGNAGSNGHTLWVLGARDAAGSGPLLGHQAAALRYSGDVTAAGGYAALLAGLAAFYGKTLS